MERLTIQELFQKIDQSLGGRNTFKADQKEKFSEWLYQLKDYISQESLCGPLVVSGTLLRTDEARLYDFRKRDTFFQQEGTVQGAISLLERLSPTFYSPSSTYAAKDFTLLVHTEVGVGFNSLEGLPLALRHPIRTYQGEIREKHEFTFSRKFTQKSPQPNPHDSGTIAKDYLALTYFLGKEK